MANVDVSINNTRLVVLLITSITIDYHSIVTQQHDPYLYLTPTIQSSPLKKPPSNIVKIDKITALLFFLKMKTIPKFSKYFFQFLNNQHTNNGD